MRRILGILFSIVLVLIFINVIVFVIQMFGFLHEYFELSQKIGGILILIFTLLFSIAMYLSKRT